MATGRTVLKHTRVYVDGYDLSGYSRNIGPLTWTFDEHVEAALTDEVKNALPGHANIGIGTLNAFLDNTATSGSHAIMSGAGVMRTVMIPTGIQAAPAQGDPAFCGQFEQLGYQQEGDGFVFASIPFGMWSDRAATPLYGKPWGVLLRPKTATTAVNSSTGVDDRGAATSLGGFMVYQVFAGNGTATLKVQDAATNADGSFSDLSGATSGSVDCSSPLSNIIPIGKTATVRRYLRWQIVLGTATTVTFSMAFVRI